MKRIITLFFVIAVFTSIDVASQDYDWKVSEQKTTTFHTDNREAKIKAYSFESVFWEPITERYANKYIKSMVSDKNIKPCRELEPLDSDWADVKLHVSAEKYKRYRSSDCRFFVHQIHYEKSKSIVFTKESNIGIATNEYGV